MQWYKPMLEHIKSEETYSHKSLVNNLKTLKPDLSDSAYNWAVNSMVRDGALARYGYDSYVIPSDFRKKEYIPVYSNISMELIRSISEKYPYIRFTIFETILLNDYLNHLIAQNTIFVQVEKESSIYVFRYLQENGYTGVMYKPDIKEFNLYWSGGCIVVTDLISEAPLRRDKPHFIMLEKMIVDMLADKLIASTFSKAEIPDIMEQVQSRYFLDKVRMLRYAARRNRKKDLLKCLEGGAVEDAVT